MKFSDVRFKIQFKNTKAKSYVTLQELGDAVVNFLEFYAAENTVGREFCGIIGEGGGEERFNRMLEAAGYKDDSWGFFVELIEKLERYNSENADPVFVKELELPYLLVLEVLKKMIPGNRFYEIKKISQYERLTNTKVPESEREEMEEVLHLYPVRLSLHTIRQMRLSQAVAWQYAPFTDELNSEGLVHTWVGQFHRGIVEQMYQNRVIFILNMSCPVYCRFCFRKHKECRTQKAPTQAHIKEAVAYIRNAPLVKELVLTGGDPFMNKATLTSAIEGLKTIPHVQSLRVATRSISYYPHLFYKDNYYWLNYLKSKNLELQQRGKKLEIATHFIHSDEVSIESLYVISELVKAGISVYVQTPFLADCNDDPKVLAKLFGALRGAGAEIHYIYIPCSPIQGNRKYIKPISDGIKVATGLRALLSDRAIPGIVTATSLGKIDWNTSGWAVEQDAEDDRYIWIRTPYTREYFESFAPILQFSDSVRVNPAGNIEAKFMVQIGDSDLFKGIETAPVELPPAFTPESDREKKKLIVSENLKQLYASTPRDQRDEQSIVPTNSDTLFRPHLTRVEMDFEATLDELENNLKYIADDPRITDVLLTGRTDPIESIHLLGEIVKLLHKIKHVNAIRIRSFKFNYVPSLYSQQIIERLGELNRLAVTLPKRVEIETRFLHSSEFSPEHKTKTTLLARQGVTVYNVTPLLGGINDDPDEMIGISSGCRKNGIEFQNLYVAGLPIQEYWNESHPVKIPDVFKVTTNLRKNGSGREIPRYLVRTELGEADFALTTEIGMADEEGVTFKMLPYGIDYYKSIYPDYQWPEGTVVDEEGVPSIAVGGLEFEEIAETPE